MGFFDFFKSKSANTTPAECDKQENEMSTDTQFNILCDDGVRALRMGEVVYAAKCFTAALQIREDLRTLGFLAEAQFRCAEFSAARATLKKLIETDAHNANVHLLMARTQDALGEYGDMDQTCQQLLAMLEDTPENETIRVSTLYYRAKAKHASGAIFEAIALLTQAISARPDFAEALFLRAQILFDMQQWNEGLTDTSQLTQGEVITPDMLLLHARLLHATGRNEESENFFEQTLQQHPFHQEAICAFVEFYQNTHRWDKALDLCNESIELMPEFADAFKLRGGIKLHLGDKLGAAEDLKTSLHLKPEQTAALEGEFTNTENRMNEHFRNMNPYKF